MEKDQPEPDYGEMPAWVKTAIPMIVAAIASAIFTKRSPEPLPEDFVRRLSEDVSRRVTEKQMTDAAFADLISSRIARAIKEVRMQDNQQREKHNYHYIRYGMLFAYVLAIAQLPGLIRIRFDWSIVRSFGIMFTLLAITIDWRNYRLYREELEKRAWPPGPVTCAITAFYIVVLLWLIFNRAMPMVAP